MTNPHEPGNSDPRYPRLNPSHFPPPSAWICGVCPPEWLKTEAIRRDDAIVTTKDGVDDVVTALSAAFMTAKLEPRLAAKLLTASG